MGAEAHATLLERSSDGCGQGSQIDTSQRAEQLAVTGAQGARPIAILVEDISE
jgi:hypothetical protein